MLDTSVQKHLYGQRVIVIQYAMQRVYYTLWVDWRDWQLAAQRWRGVFAVSQVLVKVEYTAFRSAYRPDAMQRSK